MDVVSACGGLQQEPMETYLREALTAWSETGAVAGGLLSFRDYEVPLDDLFTLDRSPSRSLTEEGGGGGGRGRTSLSRSSSREAPMKKWALSSRDFRLFSRPTRARIAHTRRTHMASLPLVAVRDAIHVSLSGERDKWTRSKDIFDPYPADEYFLRFGGGGGGGDAVSTRERKYPFPRFLFDWIMSKLSIIRTLHLPKATFDEGTKTELVATSGMSGNGGKDGKGPPSRERSRSRKSRVQKRDSTSSSSSQRDEEMLQKEDVEMTIGFDRLHGERVLLLRDAAASAPYLVVVQILHGILRGASFVSDDSSGVPQCARRFLPTEDLPDLTTGLTLLVYDSHSKVSRATSLSEKALVRVAEHFQASPDNLAFIAERILSNAESCLQLSRVAGYCTGVAFHSAEMVRRSKRSGSGRGGGGGGRGREDESYSQKEPPLSSGQRRIGLKYVINTGKGGNVMRNVTSYLERTET